MEHVVPLPPFTWAIVQAALAIAGGNSADDWIFPQQRLRRAGDSGGNTMAPGGLNIAMREAGSPIRPHVNRKIFTTYGKYLTPRIIETDAAAIMDHAEARGTTASDHYDFDEQLMAKWQTMIVWETFVLKQIKAQTPEGASDFPAFVRYVEKPWTYEADTDNLLVRLGAAM